MWKSFVIKEFVKNKERYVCMQHFRALFNKCVAAFLKLITKKGIEISAAIFVTCDIFISQLLHNSYIPSFSSDWCPAIFLQKLMTKQIF